MRVKPKLHALKTWPVFFQEIQAGRKTFEIRKNDRDFQVGDFVSLNEWDPATPVATQLKPGAYTGRRIEKEIMYVTDFPDGLRPGYVCFGLRTPDVQLITF